MLFVVVERDKGELQQLHFGVLGGMADVQSILVLLVSLNIPLLAQLGLLETLSWGTMEAVTYAAKDRASHKSK